jgi:hypothetical protein
MRVLASLLSIYCLLQMPMPCRGDVTPSNTMDIRSATIADVPVMEGLAEQKRIQYEKYQPIFYRQSQNAQQLHGGFLKGLISKPGVILLVAVDEAGVQGFIYGNLVDAPPVYNPGGKICLVDDFMVSKPEQWPTVGKALLDAVLAKAKQSGAVLGNVVCGPSDTPKRIFLESQGFSVASEWHVKSLK